MSENDHVEWPDVETVWKHIVDEHGLLALYLDLPASSYDAVKDVIYYVLAHVGPKARAKAIRRMGG